MEIIHISLDLILFFLICYLISSRNKNWEQVDMLLKNSIHQSIQNHTCYTTKMLCLEKEIEFLKFNQEQTSLINNGNKRTII